MADRTQIIHSPVDLILDSTPLGHAKAGCKVDWIMDNIEVTSHISRKMPVGINQGVPFPVVTFDEIEINEVNLARLFPNASVSGGEVYFDKDDANKAVAPLGTVRIHPRSEGASTAKDLFIYDALPACVDYSMLDPGDETGRWLFTLVLKPRWNDAGDKMWSWGTTSDVTTPTVDTISPTDDETGVAVTTNVVITFLEAMRAGDVTDKDNVVLIKEADETEAPVTLSYNGANYQLTIDPVSDLTAANKYCVMVNKRVRDLAGNEMAAHFYSGFETA